MRATLLALAGGIFLTLSCETIDTSALTVSNPNLRWFGFSLVDVGWDEPFDFMPKTNYLDEVAPFSNIADILAASPEQDIRARLAAFDALGVKAIVHVQELFFEQTGSGGALSGRLFGLRADYQARWDRFVAINGLGGNAGLVQAWYLGEEPLWNGIDHDELRLAAECIKASPGSAKVMVVEAYPTLGALRLPAAVDWVGFDHYFLRDPYGDLGFREELALLESKLSSASQELVLVMDSHYIATRHGAAGMVQADLKAVAQGYFRLANENPRVAAIIGYFWPSGFDDPFSVGARNLPAAVKAEHQRMGKAICRR